MRFFPKPRFSRTSASKRRSKLVKGKLSGIAGRERTPKNWIESKERFGPGDQTRAIDARDFASRTRKKIGAASDLRLRYRARRTQSYRWKHPEDRAGIAGSGGKTFPARPRRLSRLLCAHTMRIPAHTTPIPSPHNHLSHISKHKRIEKAHTFVQRSSPAPK